MLQTSEVTPCLCLDDWLIFPALPNRRDGAAILALQTGADGGSELGLWQIRRLAPSRLKAQGFELGHTDDEETAQSASLQRRPTQRRGQRAVGQK